MTRRPKLRLGGAAFMLVVFAAHDLHAQQFVPTGRDTLRQLPGVEVIVEPLAADLASGGIAAPAIHASIEAQLRAGGIPLFSSQNENTSPAKPYLYVQVNGVSLQGQAYALAVQVQLRQTLRSLVTASNVVNAMSWDQQVVVVVPGRSLQPVLGEIQGLVKRFVDDWKAVH